MQQINLQISLDIGFGAKNKPPHDITNQVTVRPAKT